MSHVQGPGASDAVRPIRTPRVASKPTAPASTQKPVADTIELSDAARRLAEAKPEDASAREALIESARIKLESGELYTPAAARRAAEQLLKSGDLSAADA